MSDLRIDDIRRQLADIAIKSKSIDQNEKTADTGKTFSNVLKDALSEVNRDQQDAEKSIRDYVSGKEANLHNTLLSLEKADLSFKMMMQVRGKLMEAYKQIMRTDV